MERVILIKYGELTTKKGNRNFFVNTLSNNVKEKLKGMPVKIHKDISRMYIEFEDCDLETILGKINTIFGIHEYLVAYKIESDIQKIKEIVKEMLSLQTFSTFKVETKRSDKKFPISSVDFSKEIGSYILKTFDDKKVDVHHPELLLNIEIREYYTYIYSNSYHGLGGYPTSTLGKSLLMLSGGIDSPVAGYLALKRGIKLECIYFESIPHTSLEARNKVIELTKKLAVYANNIVLHIIPFTEIQEQIYKSVENEYCITIMRRMMYRISEKLAKKRNCLAIVNGESIGQVASQTLTSMGAINDVTNMPIIRPVACLDKLEIIDLAKKIDTYDISILPFEDCCTVFVPKHPVINPKIATCEEYEKNIDFISMIDTAIKNDYMIHVKEEIENNYQELL